MKDRSLDSDDLVGKNEELAGSPEMEGRYANYFLIGHNALEFVMDFGQVYTGKYESMHSRIILSPPYAKELLRMLGQSVHTYEEQFGEMQDLGGTAPAGPSEMP